MTPKEKLDGVRMMAMDPVNQSYVDQVWERLTANEEFAKELTSMDFPAFIIAIDTIVRLIGRALNDGWLPKTTAETIIEAALQGVNDAKAYNAQAEERLKAEQDRYWQAMLERMPINQTH